MQLIAKVNLNSLILPCFKNITIYSVSNKSFLLKMFFSFLKQNSDKDECTMNQDQCDRATTLCVNQIPHYTCECLDEYDYHDGFSCTGIRLLRYFLVGKQLDV